MSVDSETYSNPCIPDIIMDIGSAKRKGSFGDECERSIRILTSKSFFDEFCQFRKFIRMKKVLISLQRFLCLLEFLFGLNSHGVYEFFGIHLYDIIF